MNRSGPNMTTSTSIDLCLSLYPEELQLPGRLHDLVAVILCVVHIMSSIVAVTANSLVIWAIKTTPPLHNPSYVLVCVLAASDFSVGAFIQPLFVINTIGLWTEKFSVYCIWDILYTFGTFLSACSFLTITVISVDRYLALVLHLRYASIVTINRVLRCLLSLFIPLLSLTIMWFWFSPNAWYKISIQIVLLSLSTVCTLAIPFSYYKIFTVLRRHKQQIQDQSVVGQRMHGFSAQINISKYRKSVFTFLYVLLALILTYLPGLINLLLWWFDYAEHSVFALGFTSTMVMLNSSINPLVYCWRIGIIRGFMASKLRRLFCLNDASVDVM